MAYVKPRVVTFFNEQSKWYEWGDQSEVCETRYKCCYYKLYTFCLSDKFSNLGIVGVIGIESNCLDLFSLSCRALGRGIEEKMLRTVGKEIDNVFFVETGKNRFLIDIIKSLGIDISE